MTYQSENRTCIAPGCQKIAFARGRCQPHYMAWYRKERAEQNRESQRKWRERVDCNARRRKPKRTGTCQVCGASWETVQPSRRYCSVRCKQIAYRGRK